MDELIAQVVQATGIAGVVLAICMKYILMKDETIKSLQTDLEKAHEKRTEDMREVGNRLMAMYESRTKSETEITHAVSKLSDSLTRLEDRFDEATGRHDRNDMKDGRPTRKLRRLPSSGSTHDTESEVDEWTGKD